MEDHTTSITQTRNSDGNTLNSPLKIIIKKENIGLEEYQHQKYQFNLFNNILNHDQYYQDIGKIKDRLEKTVPNMQKVIHSDMKRVRTNKVYERKLNHHLTGPRGLNWKFKQELQRLESDERNIERDLVRLNRDLARIALSPPLGQSPLPNQSRDHSRNQTPRLSPTADINPTIQTFQKPKLLIGRSFTINTNRATVNRLTPIKQQRPLITRINSYNEKSSWIHRQIMLKVNDNHSYLQQHAHTINQQKREIDQKLKEFLH